jgi:hypothetical protein
MGTATVGIAPSNLELLEINRKRRDTFRFHPELIYPWWRRCGVKVLLVTDGGLDYGQGDFGLSTFVHIMQNDAPSYVRFQLTLAHLRPGVTDAQVMKDAAGIVRSLKGFRFDVPDHFDPNMYDEVWLFGIETNFHNGFYAERSANPGQYPADRLGDAELRNLSAHMKRGGGVFATGDHGRLGKALCGSVVRVRNMRYWDDFIRPDTTESEVSMSGPYRNDTNQLGDAGTQFSDQSDDIPQTLDLTLYSTRVHVLKKARYPHPVLCGRDGRITVLPDHPHEGECRIPPDLALKDPADGSDEYPFQTGTTDRVSPDVIAKSRVPAGNTADLNGSKQATVAQTFGAISAYDGRLADRGRVVCDATWHHFVNVNLIGIVEGGLFDQFDRPGEDPNKHDGFLSTASGRAVLDKIKNYYTNIGVWIAPKKVHECIHRTFWWQLIYADRIMEAALVDPNVPFEKIPKEVFFSIGVHARDVLGRRASQCQTIEWMIPWIIKVMPEFVPWVNPWDPVIRKENDPLPLPFLDPWPVISVALGAAIVALRQKYPYPPEKIDDKMDGLAEAIAADGGKHGLSLAQQSMTAELGLFVRALSLKV